MEMGRHRRKAGDHKVHEPADTDAQGAASTVQGNFLTEQALHQRALFGVNHPVGGNRDELVAACFALVLLLAVMDMTILLELLGSTTGTCVSLAHGHLPSSVCSR